MKKMSCCIMILVVSILSFTFLALQTRVAEISLQTISGDASYMKAVNWETSYAINLKTFDLTLQNGLASSIRITDESDIVNTPYAEKQYYETEETNEYEDTVSGSRCKTFREPKDSLQIMYELRYLKSRKNITLATQLTQYSNAVYTLRKDSDVCENYGNSTSYKEIYVNENHTWTGSYLHVEPSLMTDGNTNELITGDMEQGIVKASDDEYYLLPVTDAYTRGTNAIYRITLSDKKEQLYQSHVSEALVFLPEGRIYESLTLVKDQLVVFSHDDQKLYFQIYDREGTSLGEVSFDQTYRDKPTAMRLFSNDQYLMLTDGKQLYLVDCETKTQKQVPWEDDKIQDMIYRNDAFYISSFTGRSDHIQFSVVQDQQLVYQGLMMLTRDKEKVEGLFRLDEGAFER